MFILSNMGKDHELLEAARNGNITIVEKILNQKAKRTGPLASLRRGPGANVRDSSGYTALHHAALNGHTDIVRLLLAHDASPDLSDSRGSSPLHLAAWAGHQDIVKLFLTHPHRPANPNLQAIENDTPLHCAAQHGHTGALTTLLAHGANPNVVNSRNETPLDLAAQYGRLQAVQMLIRAHPELLLPFKADAANSGGSATIVNHSPLHSASRNGHKNVVEVLLAAGVNVNLKTPSGTALHEAALCGKDGVVRTLLDAGADLDATDCEGRTALDILEEFPPHVTRGIVSVINNHRNSVTYDSESDEVRDVPAHKNYVTPMSLGSSYENNRGSPVHNYFNSHHDMATSPSSSMGSLGPSSPSPRPRASTGDLPEFYITMAPVKPSGGKSAPKKPPRRNLSASPTYLQPHNNLMTMSVEGYGDNKSNRSAAYEYICLARTGPKGEERLNRAYSVDQYVEMSAPIPAPRNTLTASYENTTFKSYNPNRKLKRNRDSYESFGIDFNKDKNDDQVPGNTARITTAILGRASAHDKIPQSPTHYQQPPTPEHPPPSASQAEKFIHESIRPLSQEYKRRSGLQSNPMMMESGTSPPKPMCPSLCASSGSISSSISISDRSVSTDCVEEYIGEVPFAGLFKGSTMTLNNTNLSYSSPQQQHQQQLFHTTGSAPRSQQRPKTLHPRYQEPVKPIYRGDYQKNRSHSFGGFLDDDLNSTGENDPQNCADDTKNQHKKVPNDFQSYLNKTGREHAQIAGGDDKAKLSRKMLKQRTNSEEVLSPFDEEEAWAKISEIMESFGSGILSGAGETRIIRNSGKGRKAVDKDDASSSKSKLIDLLDEHNLTHLEKTLSDNGFDNIEFMNGILEESDLVAMSVSTADREKLMEVVKALPIAQSLPILHNSNNNSILNVDQWLHSIQLSEYSDIFKKHLYTNMEGVCRVWEVELQTVLEINKVGHRKRILHSVSTNRNTTSVSTIEDLNSDLNTLKANIMELRDDFVEKLQNQQHAKGCGNDAKTSISSEQNSKNGAIGVVRHGNKKNRPAPKPPTRVPSLEIRAPSELLLGLPSNLRTQWRHSASTLISSSVKYDVYYLGSTVVKELRGTESTRKSIQKLKRDDRISIPNANANQSQHNLQPPFQQQNNQQQVKKQPVRLSISHRGVEFIDIASQSTICEHEIRNINCACQDADDLSHFAYITKDLDMNTHYCHVFNVDSMDLATEIILTLGQAFEVAYQLALRDTSPKTPSRSSILPTAARH